MKRALSLESESKVVKDEEVVWYFEDVFGWNNLFVSVRGFFFFLCQCHRRYIPFSKDDSSKLLVRCTDNRQLFNNIESCLSFDFGPIEERCGREAVYSLVKSLYDIVPNGGYTIKFRIGIILKNDYKMAIRISKEQDDWISENTFDKRHLLERVNIPTARYMMAGEGRYVYQIRWALENYRLHFTEPAVIDILNGKEARWIHCGIWVLKLKEIPIGVIKQHIFPHLYWK